MAATAQMSLGKSAWPARTSSYKVLKVGGVRRPRREVHPSVSQVYSDPKALVAKEASAARSDRTSATAESLHSKPQSDITARDHLSIWGDVEAKEANHFELFTDNKPIYDFDSLSAVGVDAEIAMADGHYFDSNDLFWTSDEPLMLVHDDADLFVEAGSGDMLMVDPRDIEGGRAAEAADAAVTDVAQELPSDLQLPEGFDLLEFVMDNSFGPDDPAFRQQIGDDALFTEDYASLTNLNEVAAVAPSHLEIATIDFDQLDLLAVAGSAPITEEELLTPEVDEVKMEADEEDDEAVEAIQAPAKRPRGRPRVPRTSAAKRLPAPRRRQSSSSGSSYDPSSNDLKYRRMRDLNNLASKRCRQNRKQKMEILDKDLTKERERNTDLKMKVRLLEEQVKRVKDAIFKAIVPVTAPRVQLVASSSPVAGSVVDIDELIRQRAADFL